MVNYFPVRPTDPDQAAQMAKRKNFFTQDGKQVLKPNFLYPIKKDKKGQNPASMLLRVLYKHLISLVE